MSLSEQQSGGILSSLVLCGFWHKQIAWPGPEGQCCLTHPNPFEQFVLDLHSYRLSKVWSAVLQHQHEHGWANVCDIRLLSISVTQSVGENTEKYCAMTIHMVEYTSNVRRWNTINQFPLIPLERFVWTANTGGSIKKRNGASGYQTLIKGENTRKILLISVLTYKISHRG